jgi:hypothetical protein
MGSPFAVRNLDVRWTVSASNALPSKVWIFSRVPANYTKTTISNLIAACSFSEGDKLQDDRTGLAFKSGDKTRSLLISIKQGNIEYEAETHYGPTNLAKGVPAMDRMPELTSNFLKSIGFNLSEIEKNERGEPNFNFSEPLTLYSSNRSMVTNIEWRAVTFRRTLEGAALVGSNCEINFGEYGKISKITMPWIGVERHKNCTVAKVEKINSWIRGGKAVQGRQPYDSGDIDWQKVKFITVQRIKICYQPTENFVYPLLALWATIQLDNETREIEIDCPLIDESQP